MRNFVSTTNRLKSETRNNRIIIIHYTFDHAHPYFVARRGRVHFDFASSVWQYTAVDGICNRQGWVSLNNYYFLYRVRSALPRRVVYSSSAEKNFTCATAVFSFRCAHLKKKLVYVLKITFSIVQGTIIAHLPLLIL